MYTHRQGRKWQTTPIFLSGKALGQRTLAGYSPQDCKRTGHSSATKQPPHIHKGQAHLRQQSGCGYTVYLIRVCSCVCAHTREHCRTGAHSLTQHHTGSTAGQHHSDVIPAPRTGDSTDTTLQFSPVTPWLLPVTLIKRFICLLRLQCCLQCLS